MEPRRPKHKQQPPLEVDQEEIERAVSDARNYHLPPPPEDEEQLEDVFPEGEVTPIDMIQTHMSMVFLLPHRVYKVKKNVDYGFADFSTLYARFRACTAEVQLNQRLAPNVYMGVVPISMQRATRQITVRCDDFWTHEKNNSLDWWLNDEFGEIIEWAVHMVRLPDDQTLLALLRSSRLTHSLLERVASHLSAFHKNARRSPRIDPFGQEDVVRRNIDENFAQTTSHVGVTAASTVYDRVRALTYVQLGELSSAFAERVASGFICDCHGDLRLEHVYALKQNGRPSTTSTSSVHSPRTPSSPGVRQRDLERERMVATPTLDRELVVLDCIEFNEQFRYGDPLSDAAFLMMDLWRMGRPDLARFFQDQYLLLSNQVSEVNSKLFRFYAAYRAVVRAKVSGFRVLDTRLSDTHRQRETQRARCYWMVALTLLSAPADRPCVVLVAGLPACGKSNLARMLVDDSDGKVIWLRADAIRKEISNNYLSNANADASATNTTGDTSSSGGGSFEEGLYAPRMTERTYEELLSQCVAIVRRGGRVLIDATFRDPTRRHDFLRAAHDEGALLGILVCECDREIVRGRMLARKNDLSDATWQVFEVMEQQWCFPDQRTMPECFTVNTEKEEELTLRRANGFLRKIELL
ncbi:TPA: hypothetical protein N0F65_011493 [Lagenidium giganteum]|uniref:Zeta toxin domain-containing protein n=1 Tax=Lagenidium giganteum TaxID=4803 RepID=A0AAV2YG50_9STRA|nr:TPA: hypothetical protein N0F65_011493 [Lagenidium giganteum]